MANMEAETQILPVSELTMPQQHPTTLNVQNIKQPGESSNFVLERIIIDQPGGEGAIHLKGPPNYLAIGFSGIIYELVEDIIMQHPKLIPNDDLYN